MSMLYTILIALATLALGILIGYIIRKSLGEKAIGSAEQRAMNLIADAEAKAEQSKKEILIEAKEEAHTIREDADKEVKERRAEVAKTEKRMLQKEESLDKRISNLDERESGIRSRENALDEKAQELNAVMADQMAELERISGYTTDEAKQVILDRVEKEVKQDISIRIRDLEMQAKEESDTKAKEIIISAIQRCAADHVAETTVSVVNLPNEEMKGRIIGREGRNIRAIETLTGVDIIIDDTPEAVVLSGFDPIRRQIAKLALEALIQDGRIHPARIEEMVERATKEVEADIKQEGESATFEVGVHNLHPELIKALGKLKYRTSYGQNVLKHSIEVANLAGLMAAEMGLDVKLAKRAGLLHDIGKSASHDVEGTHVEIGIEMLRKYKESEAVISAVASHHGDYEQTSFEAGLVAAADALSAARPGARRESLENYIKRLEKLEEIANSIEGVERSFAIQAGREVRIMVKPDQVSDEGMALLAREVSKKIESELEYPGQIKVSVIRETRAVDYAK